MLADAIAAEAFRVRHNSGVLFWGFLAVQLGVLLFNLLVDTWVGTHSHLPVALDIGRQIVDGVGLTQSAFFQVFYAAAAASLFAADYRWETWRLITPRNSRTNLIVARFIVYGIATAASLVLLGAAAMIQCGYAAAISGTALRAPAGPFLIPLLGTFLTGWCELMILGAVVALIATATRAALGALMAAMAFSFGQWVAMALVHPWEAAPGWYAALPRLSAYVLRAWVQGAVLAPGVNVSADQALTGALALAGWMMLLGVGVAALFQRQELSRE
jgi:ABC-2 type transport system permease protein